MSKERLTGLNNKIKLSKFATLPNIAMIMAENGEVEDIDQPLIPRALHIQINQPLHLPLHIHINPPLY